MNTDINFTVKATYADAQRAFEMVEKSVLDVSETIEGMTKKATQLRTALNQSKQGSEAFQFLSKELGKTETQLANATIEVQRYKNEVQNMAEINRRAGMVGLSFNRIIQDAGYFGQSAAMGFMAVGNNITYFAEQMAFAKREGLAMSTVLKGMLTGVNAWMFAINLAVSAITFFTVQNRGAKQSVDEFSLKTLIGELNEYEKSLKAVKNELSGLSLDDLAETLGRTNKELGELVEKTKIELWLRALLSRNFGGEKLADWIFGKPEELKKKFQQFADITKSALDEFSAKSSGLRSPNWLDIEIEKLTERFRRGEKTLAPAIKKLKAELKSWTDLVSDNSKTKKERPDLPDIFDISPEKLDKFSQVVKDMIEQQEELFLESELKRFTWIEENANETMRWDEIIATHMAKVHEDTLTSRIEVIRAAYKKLYNDLLQNKDKLTEQQISDFKQTLTHLEGKDVEKEIDKTRKESYKKLLTEFQRLGSNLRSIFRDAGDTFLGKMIEALNTVAAILELVETIKSIMTALDLISIAAKVATAPMTGGASLIPVGVGAPDFSRQSSPTQIMIPVYIGEEKIQTIIVDTTKRAQRLRYL